MSLYNTHLTNTVAHLADKVAEYTYICETFITCGVLIMLLMYNTLFCDK